MYLLNIPICPLLPTHVGCRNKGFADRHNNVILIQITYRTFREPVEEVGFQTSTSVCGANFVKIRIYQELELRFSSSSVFHKVRSRLPSHSFFKFPMALMSFSSISSVPMKRMKGFIVTRARLKEVSVLSTSTPQLLKSNGC
jgi:hypothetical protein